MCIATGMIECEVEWMNMKKRQKPSYLTSSNGIFNSAMNSNKYIFTAAENC